MRTKKAIDVALTVLGVAGLAGITIVAPNALQGLTPLLKRTSVKGSDYARLLKELKRQGLVYITQSGSEVHYTLTPAGAYRLQEVIVDELVIPRPSKWDKHWRMVAFDIPVAQSRSRQKFVEKLQILHFTMLQKSLWVHPFPCFDQVEQLAGHYNVLRHCTLMEISQLDELATRRLLRRYADLLRV
jgi:DNA-binding transcriptional regulator PaaX